MICEQCHEAGEMVAKGMTDEARLLHNHCKGKKKHKTHCDCQCYIPEHVRNESRNG